mmetsp:Transcript_58248/g.189873  ORF Transcript_58248/g.189873 Transcript_58248/m.189873 type:complete len:318 (-) Transcript_58248:151-1104(-)|eukprot:CAMPEP_0203906510 /NCGR_PEP_ID=MMETSP0359-20131031/48119_1 /ASSEMBLY_ACC=CAM_ASM_000338 /TAXON_ID=268821 /ORGANISM="Scrippsiella Hangoei, Strain SHTV-5" /LENGTH=317 /DNA_ID=CAMNT_0050831159 /DNA_START=58 /DNA_END=1011 /DNA_ORIENTATION=-
MHLATDNGKFDNSAAVSWKDDTNVLPTMRATGKSEDLREKLQQSVAVWEGSIRSTKSYEKRAWLGGLQRLQKSQSLTEPMRSTGCRQFINEPAAYYKRVEPFRPNWPIAQTRYQANRGVTIINQEDVIVPARGRVYNTRTGPVRYSDGEVSFSARQAMKFELDAEELARILRDVVPRGEKVWSTHKLEQEFFEQCGRFGCWAQYRIPLRLFLLLFSRTFEVCGASGESVRVLHKSRLRIVDSGQDALVALALARQNGFVRPPMTCAGEDPALSQAAADRASEELRRVRARAEYRPPVNWPANLTTKLPSRGTTRLLQ